MNPLILKHCPENMVDWDTTTSWDPHLVDLRLCFIAFIWGFLKMRVSRDGWFIMENG